MVAIDVIAVAVAVLAAGGFGGIAPPANESTGGGTDNEKRTRSNLCEAWIRKSPWPKIEIPQFYKDRFAAQDSDIANELGKLATESGVKIQQAKYKQEDAESSGLIVPVVIDGNFSGDYLQLVRFINSLERSKLFITVDSVDLAGEGAGPVKLQVSMHSYLRSGA